MEGETLACGTGAVAGALIAASLGLVASPAAVLTKGGEKLIVSFLQDGARFTGIFLEGAATVICEGTLYL